VIGPTRSRESDPRHLIRDGRAIPIPLKTITHA